MADLAIPIPAKAPVKYASVMDLLVGTQADIYIPARPSLEDVAHIPTLPPMAKKFGPPVTIIAIEKLPPNTQVPASPKGVIAQHHIETTSTLNNALTKLSGANNAADDGKVIGIAEYFSDALYKKNSPLDLLMQEEGVRRGNIIFSYSMATTDNPDKLRFGKDDGNSGRKTYTRWAEKKPGPLYRHRKRI